jgi:hypothetical protein
MGRALKEPDRTELRRWLLAHAAAGLLALLIVSVAAAKAPPRFRGGHYTTQRTLAKLSEQLREGIDALLVGNSLLERGVNVGTLRDNLAGRGCKAAVLVQDGAVSGFFYLVVKNYAAAHKEAPRLLLIFIMEDELSAPSRRIGSSQESIIKAASLSREPVFMRLVLRDLLREGHVTEALLAGLRYVWPAYSCKGNIQDGIFELMTDLPRRQLARMKRFAEWPDYQSARVMVDRQRAAGRTPQGPDPTPPERKEDAPIRDFSGSLTSSFLPEMTRLCAERGIRLGFVRLKPNPRIAAGRPLKYKAVDRHMADLKAYCDANDILFLDVSGDPNLNEDCFSRDDHMAVKGRDYLTPVIERFVLDNVGLEQPDSRRE